MFNPPNDIAFMSAIPSTSGRLHCEFVLLLFLQTHRETDRFFSASGVQLEQRNSGFFHFRHTPFSSQLRPKVGNTLVKAEVLRVNLNLDGAPITTRTHGKGSYGKRIFDRLGRTLLDEHEKLFTSYWLNTFGSSSSLLQFLGKDISVRVSHPPQGG